MKDSSYISVDKYNQTKNFNLEQFQKETPRKMTIHILSKELNDCVNFVKLFTGQKLDNAKELLEREINKKNDLYSFMNYKIYDDSSLLMEQIKKQIEFVENEEAIYSEIVIILDNEDISKQISNIENNFKEIIESVYSPFFLIISPLYINLTNFISSKTFQYKFSFKDIFKYKN